MVQSALVSWRTQNMFHHALRIYTCVSVGSTAHSHTYKNKIHNWYTLLCMLDKFRDPHSHNLFLMWVLKDTQAHIHVHKLTSCLPKNQTKWEHCDNPSLKHHTQTTGCAHTWCCSCCLPLIPACISPTGWLQSDAQPQVPWSGAQTEAPEEKEKDKMYVRPGKTEQECKRKNWDFMLGSSSECKWC